jgi:hypothetical protein
MALGVIMAVATLPDHFPGTMPASPSSPTDAAIGHLAALAQSLAGDGADLPTVLGAIADPRYRRGIRHRLPAILGLAVCAVLAGARSFTAIAEWAADAEEATLAALGVTGAVPSESTFRRTLQNLDADALDAAAGAWAARRTLPPREARRMIAVDGKTLRGSAAGGEDGRHLLAAQPGAKLRVKPKDPVPPGNSIASLTWPFSLRGWCGDGWLTRCCSRSSAC